MHTESFEMLTFQRLSPRKRPRSVHFRFRFFSVLFSKSAETDRHFGEKTKNRPSWFSFWVHNPDDDVLEEEVAPHYSSRCVPYGNTTCIPGMYVYIYGFFALFFSYSVDFSNSCRLQGKENGCYCCCCCCHINSSLQCSPSSQARFQ